MKRSILIVLTGLLVILSGCMVSPNATVTETTATTTTTVQPPASTTTTTKTTAQLTDRTAPTRLSLHPETGFSGRISVMIDGEEVLNKSFSDYDGSADLNLTNHFQPSRQTVTVVVNGTIQWERAIGTTESFELNILEDGTVDIRSHTIR